MHLDLSMASVIFFLYTLLIFSLSFHGIIAVKYVVIQDLPPNHGGAIKFNTVIGGVPYTKQIMGQITTFIWSTILKQNTPAKRKPIDTIQVYIVREMVGLEGDTVGNKINISASYLNNYAGPKDLKWAFTSLMYHEMTHVFQWDADGMANTGVVEGIADYTVLKAKYFPPSFLKPGSGDRWDKGYEVTARFFEYCEGLVPGFVAQLNSMMRKTYDVSFIKNITGKPVEQLWKEYKAKYPRVN